jgi:hypothetical protein
MFAYIYIDDRKFNIDCNIKLTHNMSKPIWINGSAFNNPVQESSEIEITSNHLAFYNCLSHYFRCRSKFEMVIKDFRTIRCHGAFIKSMNTIDIFRQYNNYSFDIVCDYTEIKYISNEKQYLRRCKLTNILND